MSFFSLYKTSSYCPVDENSIHTLPTTVPEPVRFPLNTPLFLFWSILYLISYYFKEFLLPVILLPLLLLSIPLNVLLLTLLPLHPYLYSYT